MSQKPDNTGGITSLENAGQGEGRGNHTPGPWSVESVAEVICGNLPSPHMVIGDDCEIVADVHREANARLIAAAPDLLEALEYAVSMYGKPGGPWSIPADPGGWLDRARTAIAKARGE